MPAARSRRRPSSTAPGPSIAPLILVGSVPAACAAGWYRWPSVPILWAALTAAAWSAIPAVYTGRKDSYGYPTPANPAEEKKMAAWQTWQQIRWRAVVPSGDWAPGWPVLGAWLGAVLAAGLAALIPAWPIGKHWTAADTRAVNAAAAFVATVTAAAGRRRYAGGDCPGARLDSLARAFRKQPPAAAVSFVFGAVAGAVAADVAVHLIARQPPGPGFAEVPDRWLLWPLLIAAGAGVGVTPLWRREALGEWRSLRKVRFEWAPRWLSLKIDPAPTVAAHDEIGGAAVDTFDAPGHMGAMTFWPMAPKIVPTLGAGMKIAVLECPDDGPSGPVPGTRNPLRFKIASWPAEQLPDPADSSVDQAVVELFAHCAMVWALEPQGYGRPVPVEFERLSAPDSPAAVWASRWAWPGGPSLTEIRPLVDSLSAAFGCQVLVDHRADAVYFGAVGAATGIEQVVWSGTDDDAGAWTKTFSDIEDEDRWNRVWAATLKMGAQPPTIQPATRASAQLADGTTVHSVAFMARLGVDPGEFRGLEPKLITAMDGPKYVSIVGWPASGGRPGDRHPQAIAVYWSEKPIPASPDRVAPSKAAKLALAGLVNSAFDANRMPRPEIAAVRALTATDSRGHIWEIALRLYGGVSLSDMRLRSDRFRQAFGCAWLRVGEAADGCVLYVGADPGRATLAGGERDARRLAGLDWEQAWLDAKMLGAGGVLPDLTGVSRLPNNNQVEVLDFSLPPGVDRSRVRAAIPKLKISRSCEFIEDRDSPDGAGSVRLLVSESNPLPERVPFDFDTVDRLVGIGIPFATGVEGEPVTFDPIVNPHSLLAGVTGAGKSVLAQAFIYGLLVGGARLVVIDPQKGGADFRFAEPYADYFATTTLEAAACMKAVYAEVVRRKDLNSKHGVGSYLDLPDGERPPALVVMIDEFTSLIGTSPVPKASDDPDLEVEREAILAENQARTEIGVYAGRLAREARSAGVTLLLGTQRLSAKMLESIPGASDLRTNLARVLLGKASWGDRAAALRAPDDAPILDGDIPKGRGLWEPLTSAAMIVQCWFAPQTELGENLARRRHPLERSEKLDIAPFLRSSGGGPPGELAGPDPEPVSGDEVVVDVGELTFSLDDLELDEADTTGSTGEWDSDGWDMPACAPEIGNPGTWDDDLDWSSPSQPGPARPADPGGEGEDPFPWPPSRAGRIRVAQPSDDDPFA